MNPFHFLCFMKERITGKQMMKTDKFILVTLAHACVHSFDSSILYHVQVVSVIKRAFFDCLGHCSTTTQLDKGALFKVQLPLFYPQREENIESLLCDPKFF